MLESFIGRLDPGTADSGTVLIIFMFPVKTKNLGYGQHIFKSVENPDHLNYCILFPLDLLR